MPKLTVLVATIALAGTVQADAQSPDSEDDSAELVASCNVMASSPKPRGASRGQSCGHDSRVAAPGTTDHE